MTLETTAYSPADSGQVAEPKRYARSKITNGSALLPGVDGRSAWVRRCKDVIREHLSDIPDASVAERSILRRAAVLTTELERIELKFAQAGEAGPVDANLIDLYSRAAANLRRLLESVGLHRRPRDVSPLDDEGLRAYSEELAAS